VPLALTAAQTALDSACRPALQIAYSRVDVSRRCSCARYQERPVLLLGSRDCCGRARAGGHAAATGRSARCHASASAAVAAEAPAAAPAPASQADLTACHMPVEVCLVDTLPLAVRRCARACARAARLPGWGRGGQGPASSSPPTGQQRELGCGCRRLARGPPAPRHPPAEPGGWGAAGLGRGAGAAGRGCAARGAPPRAPRERAAAHRGTGPASRPGLRLAAAYL